MALVSFIKMNQVLIVLQTSIPCSQRALQGTNNLQGSVNYASV